jgi:fused signal recognition particle receptor
VLTKLDGTAKGGVVLGIVDEHHIPVRYVGIGERVEDLREFDPESFVSALFEKPEPEAVEA